MPASTHKKEEPVDIVSNLNQLLEVISKWFLSAYQTVVLLLFLFLLAILLVFYFFYRIFLPG